MQNGRENNPGIVITLGYTDGQKLKGIPPKDKEAKHLKVVFMTPELLAELEARGEVTVLAKAYRTSEKTGDLGENTKTGDER